MTQRPSDPNATAPSTLALAMTVAALGASLGACKAEAPPDAAAQLALPTLGADALKPGMAVQDKHQPAAATQLKFQSAPGALTQHKDSPVEATQAKFAPGALTQHKDSPVAATQAKLAPGALTQHKDSAAASTEPTKAVIPTAPTGAR